MAAAAMVPPASNILQKRAMSETLEYKFAAGTVPSSNNGAGRKKKPPFASATRM